MTDTAIPAWSIGERLAKARHWAGYHDQSAFAVHIGCDRSTVSRIERNATRPNRRTLIAWSSATGVPLAWLMGEDDASRTPPPNHGYHAFYLPVALARAG